MALGRSVSAADVVVYGSACNVLSAGRSKCLADCLASATVAGGNLAPLLRYVR